MFLIMKTTGFGAGATVLPRTDSLVRHSTKPMGADAKYAYHVHAP